MRGDVAGFDLSFGVHDSKASELKLGLQLGTRTEGNSWWKEIWNSKYFYHPYNLHHIEGQTWVKTPKRIAGLPFIPKCSCVKLKETGDINVNVSIHPTRLATLAIGGAVVASGATSIIPAISEFLNNLGTVFVPLLQLG